MKILDDGKVYLSQYLDISFESPSGFSSFFGYYNNTPIDKTGTKLLSHKTRFDGRTVFANDYAEVGYYDLTSGAWMAIDKTFAFNWQLGSMLQWVGPDYKSKIIYNSFDGEKYIAKLFDIRKGTVKIYENPIFAIQQSGRYALSVNFERLLFCHPSYSYKCVENEKWHNNIHPEDGITRIDLHSGEVKLLISTEKISDIERRSITTPNFLEHVVIAPDDNNFAFLHRYLDNNFFQTRLFTSDINGGNIFKYPEFDIYSHLAWKNSDEFIIWANKKKLISKKYIRLAKNTSWYTTSLISLYRYLKNKLLNEKQKKIIENLGGNYFSFSLNRHKTVGVAPNYFYEDGHPTWTEDGRYIVTDTYNDNYSYRKLLLYDTLENRGFLLGKFYSSYNNCDFRCDLHPRLSPDGNHIIIDSAHNTNRKIMVFRVNWPLIEG